MKDRTPEPLSRKLLNYLIILLAVGFVLWVSLFYKFDDTYMEDSRYEDHRHL